MQLMKKLVIVLAFLALLCSAQVVRPTGKKIVGYWGCNPGSLQTSVGQLQTAINKGYNVIIFAFYIVGADGSITKDTGSISTVPTKSAVASSQFTYLISLFGGQNGMAPTLTTTPDVWAQNMFNSFQALHQQFGFDGIDIDLENNWGPTTGDLVACGIRSFFKLMHNAGFVVSLAPQTTALTNELSFYQTSNWNSYAPLLDSSIIDYVDIVAVQLYNNAVPGGSAEAYTNILTTGFQVNGCPSCGSTTTGFVKIPASKLAHGYPASIGAAPGGCSPFDCPYGSALSAMYAASSVLRTTGGVMTWSIEWDEAGSWAFINSASTISFLSGGSSSSTSAPVVTSAPIATQAPTQKATVAPTPKATVAPTQKATQAPTAAPVTAAPAKVTVAPVTAAPAKVTVAPVTSAPAKVTQAPAKTTVAPTSAPAKSTQPPPAQPITTTCRMSWSQVLASSWGSGSDTYSMYTVTLKADASLANFNFKLVTSATISSIWDAPDAGSGMYTLPSWLFSAGSIQANTAVSFGYIVQSTQPATIAVVGNPCQ